MASVCICISVFIQTHVASCLKQHTHFWTFIHGHALTYCAHTVITECYPMIQCDLYGLKGKGLAHVWSVTLTRVASWGHRPKVELITCCHQVAAGQEAAVVTWLVTTCRKAFVIQAIIGQFGGSLPLLKVPFLYHQSNVYHPSSSASF